MFKKKVTFLNFKSFKRLNEKSRECHNYNLHSTPDTKKKRKRQKSNAYKINIYARSIWTKHEKHLDQLSVITVLNSAEKHENNEQSKTQHETPRGKKHKGTKIITTPGPTPKNGR